MSLGLFPKAFPQIKLDKSVVSLDTFSPDKVELVDYHPHKSIRGKLSVSGGYFDEEQKEIIEKIHKQSMKK